MLYFFDVVKQQQRRKSKHYCCLSVLNRRMTLQFILIQWRFPPQKPLCFSWLCVTCLAEHHFVWLLELIGCTYDVLGNPGLRACSRDEINNFVQVVCVVNLQQIVDLLRRSWAFSLALDSATHQNTSFLDLRFQVFIPNYHSIINLHGCALPMFDRHTRDIMSTMVSKFLTVLCLDWTIRLLGLMSNKARNMTGRIASVVTCLNVVMHSDCSLIRIWCGAHQLDLVMEDIISNVIKERFFSIMTRFIIHLTRQQNLIAEMQTTCLRVINCWLSTKKVINWFKIHRPQLLAHIKSKQPASTPPHLWWVAFLSMHHFTTWATVTFRSI